MPLGHARTGIGFACVVRPPDAGHHLVVAQAAKVVEVPGLAWDVGAPEPVVVSSERRTLFAFYLSDLVVDDGFEVQVAEFTNCLAVRFGFPNDEALHGHPLWDSGIDYYALHEVYDSEWVELLRAIERQHPHSPDLPFEAAKHYLLTFKESTLEAIATAVLPTSRHRTFAEATVTMINAISG